MRRSTVAPGRHRAGSSVPSPALVSGAGPLLTAVGRSLELLGATVFWSSGSTELQRRSVERHWRASVSSCRGVIVAPDWKQGPTSIIHTIRLLRGWYNCERGVLALIDSAAGERLVRAMSLTGSRAERARFGSGGSEDVLVPPFGLRELLERLDGLFLMPLEDWLSLEEDLPSLERIAQDVSSMRARLGRGDQIPVHEWTQLRDVVGSIAWDALYRPDIDHGVSRHFDALWQEFAIEQAWEGDSPARFLEALERLLSFCEFTAPMRSP